MHSRSDMPEIDHSSDYSSDEDSQSSGGSSSDDSLYVMAEHDPMDNTWGCRLCIPNGRRFRGSGSLHVFDSFIRGDVPGYFLKEIMACGSSANERALLLASNFCMEQCLFGLGCYLGGTDKLQNLSTSGYSTNHTLCLPKTVQEASEEAKSRTVPLPYFINSAGHNDDDHQHAEDSCLAALHKKLLVAKLKGTPYRVLILEYMLGGNGGELSSQFLSRLGPLLKHFDVVVIADEVLTAGRVGPTMLMTSSMPRQFTERVKYITVGKFMNLAVLLEQIPTTPVSIAEELRGTSTHIECGEACGLWCEITNRVKNGVIDVRRQQVLSLLKITDGAENCWGKGCLIFSSLTREQVARGLKNRCLPLLEAKVKLKKLTCKRSDWTRSTTNEVLVERRQQWLQFLEDQYIAAEAIAWQGAIASYMLNSNVIEFAAEDKDFLFRAEDVLKHMGTVADQIVDLCRNLRRSKKSAKAFVNEALVLAMTSNDDNFLKRVRKGSGRVEYFLLISKESLVHV